MAANAISTFKTYLMYKEGGTMKKLVDISQFGDLGSDPNTIDVTTLSDPQEKFIPGIKKNDNITFNAYYTKEAYTLIAGLKDVETTFGVWFGSSDDDGATPDGNRGKFEFDGFVNVRVTGGGVDEAVGMSVIVTPSGEIKMVE